MFILSMFSIQSNELPINLTPKGFGSTFKESSKKRGVHGM